MKGYWIVSADLQDMEKFKQYVAKAPVILQQHSGRYLVRAGESSAVEGQARSRNTIIEFPSYQQALDCWYSEEYQAARELRLGAAEINIVIVAGLSE